MGEVPLSLHVTADLKKRLEDEARELNISADDLAEWAIESFLEVQDAEREILRQRIAEADSGGPFISGEAMHRWIESWDTENELPPPEPDVSPQPRK